MFVGKKEYWHTHNGINTSAGFYTDGWIESSVELCGAYRLKEKLYGMFLDFYCSYRLGLHGEGLQNKDDQCLHSLAGKISISDSADRKNRVIIGGAAHLNDSGVYLYIEATSDHLLPVKGVSGGIGVGKGIDEDEPVSIECFLKIALPQLSEYLHVPALKLGIRQEQLFLRLGSE